ncbi:MAG TPA: hypothetical protein PLY23_02375 [Alphaproteobacteria bacterium]|nr:hypothetical protein [Alphaproteobacteria bacterium]HQS93498.1 hypothetical protein [Alphaproteobacteria bacterium]
MTRDANKNDAKDGTTTPVMKRMNDFFGMENKVGEKSHDVRED